jgi:hypothetical protein
MTDYSRGYAAGLKAAAEVCRNVISDYGSGAADIVLANIERLPIEGDAEGAGPDVVVPVEPTDTPINPVVQEAIDNFGRYYAERHKLGMSIRSDMQYIARLASRWAEK